MIENCNSVGTGAHKVGKVVFGPTLTLIFPIFGEHEKGKLYRLKKVKVIIYISVYFRRYKNIYVIALSCL